MTSQHTQSPRQISFNDMPHYGDRRPRTGQRSANLSATQQHHNGTYDLHRVTDDRTPAIESVEVVSVMFSFELLVRRDHPQIVP
jgi:hypothetical protein